MNPATIFLDTSGIIAVLDAYDSFHAQAEPLWKQWIHKEVPLLTSNYVVVEATAVGQRHLGFAAAAAIHQDMLPSVQVVWMDETLHQQAVDTLLAAQRRQLSLVDCSSFVLMRKLGLHHVFTFDKHFAEQGFLCYPEIRV
jgi:predicted nucleic acid-binding protein